MSVRAMAWVWEYSKAAPTERLVLLAIADCANDQGEAWPSMAALTQKTALSERTVQRAVMTLVDLGELSASIGGGRGKTTRYRLMQPSTAETPSEKPRNAERRTPSQKPRNSDAVSEKPRQPRQETPSSATQNPVTVTPGTVREPSEEPSTTPNGVVPRARTRETGSRIPDDFAATSDMIAWARRETPLVGAKETEAFVDYWRSKPGAAGRKTDWLATWRNWMRRAQADAERNRTRNPPSNLPRGYVERDGRVLKVETAHNLDMLARMQALDEADAAAKAQPPTREIAS